MRRYTKFKLETSRKSPGIVLVIFFVMIFAACYDKKTDSPITVNETVPTPSPLREYNEKRLPAMQFHSWHKSKAGMILTESMRNLSYLKTANEKPVRFDEYKVENYDSRENPARSHDGQYEVELQKTKERVRYTDCCAIQEFDYEAVLYNVKTLERVSTLLESSGSSWDIKGWSPDDKFVLFKGSRELFVVNVQTKEKIILANTSEQQAIFTKTGLFVLEWDGTAYETQYFDINTRQLSKVFASEKNRQRIVLSPDGKRLAVFVTTPVGNTTLISINHLYVFDAVTFTKIGDYDLPAGDLKTDEKRAWNEKGSEIGFTLDGEDSAQDVYSFNTETGKAVRWYPPTGETTKLYK